jgi:hypothetical protein
MSDQLYELSRPFPESLVKQKPGKFSGVVRRTFCDLQRLLEVVGPHTFTVDSPVLEPGRCRRRLSRHPRSDGGRRLRHDH